MRTEFQIKAIAIASVLIANIVSADALTTTNLSHLSNTSDSTSQTTEAIEAPQMSMQMTINEGGGYDLSLNNPTPLQPGYYYVLQSSTDLKSWSPYKVFATPGTKLKVPKRYKDEFFRAVAMPCPKVLITLKKIIGSGNQWRVITDYKVDPATYTGFPDAGSLYPPYQREQKYSPFEIGLVGYPSGHLVFQTSQSFEEVSQVFSTQALAQAHANALQTFIAPRAL